VPIPIVAVLRKISVVFGMLFAVIFLKRKSNVRPRERRASGTLWGCYNAPAKRKTALQRQPRYFLKVFVRGIFAFIMWPSYISSDNIECGGWLHEDVECLDVGAG